MPFTGGIARAVFGQVDVHAVGLLDEALGVCTRVWVAARARVPFPAAGRQRARTKRPWAEKIPHDVCPPGGRVGGVVVGLVLALVIEEEFLQEQ